METTAATPLTCLVTIPALDIMVEKEAAQTYNHHKSWINWPRARLGSGRHWEDFWPDTAWAGSCPAEALSCVAAPYFPVGTPPAEPQPSPVKGSHLSGPKKKRTSGELCVQPKQTHTVKTTFQMEISSNMSGPDVLTGATVSITHLSKGV